MGNERGWAKVIPIRPVEFFLLGLVAVGVVMAMVVNYVERKR
jgi:hypothetical protein